jgi:bifunctional NMN adenylyltransferase/nudix hydrolase
MSTDTKNDLKNGLVVMRCQPFHNGHFALLHKALFRCDKLYILLGSTQEKRTYRNPFSFEERMDMITSSMNYEFIERIVIKGVPDIFNMGLWGDYVLSNIPEKIDIVFGGENSDISFYPKNIAKLNMKRESTPFISGTEVRELIFKNNPVWKYHVPCGTLKIIEQLQNNGEILWENLTKL